MFVIRRLLSDDQKAERGEKGGLGERRMTHSRREECMIMMENWFLDFPVSYFSLSCLQMRRQFFSIGNIEIRIHIFCCQVWYD